MKELGIMFDNSSITFYDNLPKKMVNISKNGDPEMINKALLIIRNYYEFPLYLLRNGVQSQVIFCKLKEKRLKILYFIFSFIFFIL